MNTTATRYDTAFYVQALDRFVATGECAETDTEPLYAYLLSVMNDSMVKVQVLGDEVCARIFYDTMIQFIQLNLEMASRTMSGRHSSTAFIGRNTPLCGITEIRFALKACLLKAIFQQ